MRLLAGLCLDLLGSLQYPSRPPRGEGSLLDWDGHGREEKGKKDRGRGQGKRMFLLPNFYRVPPRV